MTAYERDHRAIENDYLVAREILERRASAIQRLKDELRTTRNGFRARCILQDLDRLGAEYRALDALV